MIKNLIKNYKLVIMIVILTALIVLESTYELNHIYYI